MDELELPALRCDEPHVGSIHDAKPGLTTIIDNILQALRRIPASLRQSRKSTPRELEYPRCVLALLADTFARKKRW